MSPTPRPLDAAVSGEPSGAPGEAFCLACGSAPLGATDIEGCDRLLGVPGRFGVALCASCGAGTTLPPASPDELAGFYPDAYGPYDAASGRLVGAISNLIRRRQSRSALRRTPLAALQDRPPGRLVDVGCGRGDLGEAMIGHGWQVTGVEPSAHACEQARRRGIDARPGTLATVELEPSSYDAAVFLHSLEHTAEPREDLARIHAALRPGGLALITVPNFGSWQAHSFGSRWFHLDLPRHRVHLTPEGLTRVLERAGFSRSVIATSTSSVGLPGSVQYSLFGRCLFPGGLALRVASGLALLGYPVAWGLDRLTRRPDLLHAVAVRD